MALPLIAAGLGTSLLGGLFGSKKVKVPELKKVNQEAEQKAAVQQNIDVLPQAEDLAQRTNMFSQAQLMKQLKAVVPDIESIQSQVSSNIASQLKGEIPKDVAEGVQRSAATRATYGGFGGSGAGRNLTARDLALTSFDISNKAMDSASRWLATARTSLMAPTMDVTSMFITPQQRIATVAQENQAQFQRDMAAAQAKAQPSGFQSALGGMFQTAGGFLLGKGLGQLTSPGAGGWFGGPSAPSNPNVPEFGNVPSAPLGAGDSQYNAVVGGTATQPFNWGISGATPWNANGMYSPQTAFDWGTSGAALLNRGGAYGTQVGYNQAVSGA